MIPHDDRKAHEAGAEPPSKSARKRAAHAAQDLGEALTALRDAELEALELPEALLDAIRAARRITSRAAAVRQRQYIGRLMREVDLESIRAALATRDARTRRDAERAARAHRALAPAPADGPGPIGAAHRGRPRRARAPRQPRRCGAGAVSRFARIVRYNAAMTPLVGIIMGSSSDWETMQSAAELLDTLAVPYEVRVVSAHRTPDLLFEYASGARARGLEVLIAGAGGAAHLPGMTAAKTLLPVLGVPVQSKSLGGLDSLLSIVQMPAGVPVATFAIGAAGAANAALCAAAILANRHPEIATALEAYRERQTLGVLRNPDPRATPRS
ncbi:MAG: 5-(carboxyamino)imidazole ribonucleotide mutase [Gammaproteobacteria bacterium]|nr:MAG: 5-(carboxyamino)imidazole ribonucleotide mutase [Gammaproteobacteria bacterium]